MKRLAPLALAPLALLSGCVWVMDGHGRTYRGEYAAYAPHLGFFGLLLACFDLWACYHVWTSKRRGVLAKLLWTLFIWCCPCVGLIVFFLFGYEG
jgi:hypothetical protein